MSNETKYIYYRGFDEIDRVVIFDMFTNHNEVAQRLRIPKERIHSAGFLSMGFNDDQRVTPTPYGRSESLSIESNREHSEPIAKLLGWRPNY